MIHNFFYFSFAAYLRSLVSSGLSDKIPNRTAAKSKSRKARQEQTQKNIRYRLMRVYFSPALQRDLAKEHRF